MDLFKKLFAGIASFALVAMTAMPALNAMAADVPAEYTEAYTFASENGLTSMDTFEGFSFYGSLEREHFARFAVMTLESNNVGELTHSEADCQFDDLAEGDQTLTDYVVKSCQYGLMGIDSATNTPMDEFNPNDVMTRGQVLTVISRILDGDEYNGGSPYWKNHEANLFDKGVVTKLHPTVNANAPSLRGYATIMLQRTVEDGYLGEPTNECADGEILVEGECLVMDTVCDDETTVDLLKTVGMYEELCGEGSEEPTCEDGYVYDEDAQECVLTEEDCEDGYSRDGDQGVCVQDEEAELKEGVLEISRNEGTVLSDGDVIPMNGTVSFMGMDITAGDVDVTVSKIKIERVGLGSSDDVDRVYFEKDGVRISSRSALDTEGMAYVSFTPALEIKAGDTFPVELVADLEATSAGSRMQFKVVEVDSSAEETLGLGLLSPSLDMVKYTVAQATFKDLSASGTVYSDGMYRDLKLGEFKVENYQSSGDDKVLSLNAMTFKNVGNADLEDSLEEVVVKRNGEVVSKEVTFDGRDMTVRFDNETVATNKTAVYTIFADVMYVDNSDGDTYQFQVKSKDYVNVTEDSTKFRVSYAVQSNGETATHDFPFDLGLYTVKGGDLMLRNDESSDRTQDVMIGAKGVEVMKGTLTARNGVLLEDHIKNGKEVTITLTDTTKKLGDVVQRVELHVGDQMIVGNLPNNSDTVTSGVVEFDGTFMVNGQVDVKVLVDVKSVDGIEGTKVKFSDFRLDGFNTIEYIDSENMLDTADFVGYLAATTLTVKDSDLTAARTDMFADKTIVEGATNVTLLEAEISNASERSVNISNLTFSGGTSNYDGKVATYLYVNDVRKGQYTYDGGGDEKASYNVNFDVVKDETVTVKIVGDFEAGATGDLQLVLDSFIGTDVEGVVYNLTNSSDMSLTTTTFNVNSQAGSGIPTQYSDMRQDFILAEQYQELGTFNLEAYDDTLSLTDLYVAFTGGIASGNLESRVSTVKLVRVDSDGAEVATLDNAGSYFKDGSGVVGYYFDISSNNEIADDENARFVVKGLLNGVTAETTAMTGKLYIPLSVMSGNTLTESLSGMMVEQSNGTLLTGVYAPLQAEMEISKENMIVNAYPLTVDKTTVDNTDNLKSLRFEVTAKGGTVRLTGFNLEVSGVTGDYSIYKSSTSTSNLVGTGNGSTFTMLGAGTQTDGSGNAAYVQLSENDSVLFIVQFDDALASDQTRTVSLNGMTYLDVVDGTSSAVIDASVYYSAGEFPLVESRSN